MVSPKGKWIITGESEHVLHRRITRKIKTRSHKAVLHKRAMLNPSGRYSPAILNKTRWFKEDGGNE